MRLEQQLQWIPCTYKLNVLYIICTCTSTLPLKLSRLVPALCIALQKCWSYWLASDEALADSASGEKIKSTHVMQCAVIISNKQQQMSHHYKCQQQPKNTRVISMAAVTAQEGHCFIAIHINTKQMFFKKFLAHANIWEVLDACQVHENMPFPEIAKSCKKFASY